MPTRNRVKTYGAGEYYHVYNRGVNKQPIFNEKIDYSYFLSLFKRYLHATDDEVLDRYGRAVKSYSDEVELVAFCLMPNHFHLMLYLKEENGIVHLMRSVMTAYTMYFNKKYQRTGPLYQNIYLASHIQNDMYFWHISRYIHLNPMDISYDYTSYPYSSFQYFIGKRHASWLHPELVLQGPTDVRDYANFVADYEAMHSDLGLIKQLLAGS